MSIPGSNLTHPESYNPYPHIHPFILDSTIKLQQHTRSLPYTRFSISNTHTVAFGSLFYLSIIYSTLGKHRKTKEHRSDYLRRRFSINESKSNRGRRTKSPTPNSGPSSIFLHRLNTTEYREFATETAPDSSSPAAIQRHWRPLTNSMQT